MSGSERPSLEQLFHAALERPDAERRAWLEHACDGEEALLARVLALLDADVQDGDPVADPVERSLEGMGSVPTEGRRLGPWRVLRALGEGGMGSVVLAERADDEYHRKVAIKLIRGFPDSASLERLRAERQILADLHHPDIATMIDGGTTDDGQPYLVMEYVEGRPIDAWCTAQGVDLTGRVALVRRLCAAVHHAHQNLVIHRDLKPDNVLVTDDGRPVLLDFGIAKLLPTDAVESDGRTRGARFYTPGFSAPEQLAGERVSTATDVYSMGKLLQLLLDGLPSDRRDRVPADLQAIVERATREQPGERYASMASMGEDLGRFLAGEAVLAAAGRWRYRARKFISRYRWPLAALALAVLIAGGLVRQIVLEGERARDAEQRALLEAANARQTLEFLTGMIESAEPGSGGGRELRVVDVLEQARAALETRSIDAPALRARTLFSIGRLYRVMELYQPALELLTEAAALAAQVGDDELQIEALSIGGMAAVLGDQPEPAGRALEQAVEIARSNRDIPALVRAAAINNLGIYANESDDQARALALISEALELRRAAGAPPETIATSLHNLGEVHDLMGQPRRALEYYREALALKRDSIGRMHPSYARSLNGIALTARQIGEYDAARAAIEEQLQIRIELFGPEHPGLLRDYNELAGNEHDRGRFGAAIEAYRRALELDRLAPGGGSNDWLITNNMAAAYRDLGLNTRAQAMFRESIALRSERFGPADASTLRARHNLASSLLADGDVEAAAIELASALPARIERLGEDHPDVLRSRILEAAIRAAQQPQAETVAVLQRLIEQLAEVFSPDNYSVLASRLLLAQRMIDAGLYAEARAELGTTAGYLREALHPEHPLADVAELELARIDLLEQRGDAATARLEGLREPIQATFPAEALPRRQLDCLERGDPDARCWLNPG